MTAEGSIEGSDALKDDGILESQNEYLEDTCIADNELSSEFQGKVHTKKTQKECKKDKGTLREKWKGVFTRVGMRIRLKAHSLIRFYENRKPNADVLRNVDGRKGLCKDLVNPNFEDTGRIIHCINDGADALEEGGHEELFVKGLEESEGSSEFHVCGFCYCANDWSDTVEENDQEESFAKGLEDNELSSDFDVDSLCDCVNDGSDVLAEDDKEERSFGKGWENSEYSSDFRGNVFTVVKTITEFTEEDSYNKEGSYASLTNDGQDSKKHDLLEFDMEGNEVISDNDMSSDCLGDIYCLGERNVYQDTYEKTGKAIYIETGMLCETQNGQSDNEHHSDGKGNRDKMKDGKSTSASVRTKSDTTCLKTLNSGEMLEDSITPNIDAFGTELEGILEFEGSTTLYNLCGKRVVMYSCDNQQKLADRLHGHETLQVIVDLLANFCTHPLGYDRYPNTVATRLVVQSEKQEILASYGLQNLQPRYFLTIAHLIEPGRQAFLVLQIPLPGEATSYGCVMYYLLCHRNQKNSPKTVCFSCSALITKVDGIVVVNECYVVIQRMYNTYMERVIRKCIPYDDLIDNYECLIGLPKHISSLLLQGHASDRILAKSLNAFLALPAEIETEQIDCPFAIAKSLSWQRFAMSSDVDHHCIPSNRGSTTRGSGEVERGRGAFEDDPERNTFKLGFDYCVQVGDRNEYLREGWSDCTDIQILKTVDVIAQCPGEMYTASRHLCVFDDNAVLQLGDGVQELKMHLDLSINDEDISSKIYDNWDDFDFALVNYPHLEIDVPRATSYGVYISQLFRFARTCSSVEDFQIHNRTITEKLLKKGYRFNKLQQTFSKLYYRNLPLINK